jgi:branched-chain amino acid transport system substrate-binding protein
VTASGLKNGLRAAAFVAAGFAINAASAETVKIGMVNSLTGPHASFDLPASEGIEMAFDEINKKGGITVGGKKYTFTVVSEDAQSKPESTAS